MVISSEPGHRPPAFTPEQDAELAYTPVDGLLALSMLQPGRLRDGLHAYQVSGPDVLGARAAQP